MFVRGLHAGPALVAKITSTRTKSVRGCLVGENSRLAETIFFSGTPPSSTNTCS